MNEVITPETLPDGSQLNPADGGGAAHDAGSISLADLSKILGKEFPDVETALKSVKDTYSYVGSQAQYREKIGALAETLGTDEEGVLTTIDTLMSELNNGGQGGEGNDQTPTPQVNEGQYVTKDDLFFMQNKEMNELRDVLTPIKNASDETRAMPWEQFVTTDTAKKVIEPITGYREIQNQRTVLEGGTRLGGVTDVLAESERLVQESFNAERQGDVLTASRAMNAARKGAVDSVIEAYGLDK